MWPEVTIFSPFTFSDFYDLALFWIALLLLLLLAAVMLEAGCCSVVAVAAVHFLFVFLEP